MHSYMNATINRMPEKTLEDFYINSFGLKLYSMFLKVTQRSFGGVIQGMYPPTGGRSVLKDFALQRSLKIFSIK